MNLRYSRGSILDNQLHLISRVKALNFVFLGVSEGLKIIGPIFLRIREVLDVREALIYGY